MIVLLSTVSIWIQTQVPVKELLPHQQTGSHVVHQPQTPIVMYDPETPGLLPVCSGLIPSSTETHLVAWRCMPATPVDNYSNSF